MQFGNESTENERLVFSRTSRGGEGIYLLFSVGL